LGVERLGHVGLEGRRGDGLVDLLAREVVEGELRVEELLAFEVAAQVVLAPAERRFEPGPLDRRPSIMNRSVLAWVPMRRASAASTVSSRVWGQTRRVSAARAVMSLGERARGWYPAPTGSRR